MATKKSSSGGFSQMPKMMTTEPTVILKLKKGGHVGKRKVEEDHGHMDMMNTAQRKKHDAEMEEHSEEGESPMKPSMSERRKAMAGSLLMSKKGGKVEKEIHKVEKELKKHEGEKAGKAHHGLKAGGRAMDSFETKTTIEGNEKKYAKSKMMDGEHHDKHSGTGSIKEGKPAGYKVGGTIEGNEGCYEHTDMVTAKRDTSSGTKGIKMGNAGGYKKGGMIGKSGLSSASLEHDGDFENRPANGTPKGKTNGKTGEVRNSNAGGYKKGGALKKHYATGGRVNDEGKATPMAHHFISEPVSNSRQSGTFKKGGHIKKFADGGMMEEKPKKADTSAMRKLLGMGSPMARKKGGSTNC